MIKLSIVIPTKNSPETLSDLLKSLSDQTYAEHLEIIIVHNIEKTFFVNKYANFKDNFPNFIYTCSHQLGVNTARNVGLRLVTSPIVWFLDDDCYLNNSEIAEKLIEKHINNLEIAGIGGGYKVSEKNINIYTKTYHKIAMQWLYNSKDLKGKQLYLIGGNASYKMRDIQHSFDEYITFGGSELSFNRRLIVLNRTILLDPELDVEHRNSINFLEFINKAYHQGKGHYHNFKNLKHGESGGKIGLKQQELSLSEKIIYETYHYCFYLGFYNRKNKNKSKLHYLSTFYHSFISTFFYEFIGKFISKPIFVFTRLITMPFALLFSNLWKIKIPFHYFKLHFWKFKKPFYFITTNFWKIKEPLYFLKKNFWKIKKPLYFISLNIWKLKIPFYFISKNLWRLKLPFYKIYYCGKYHVKTYLLLGFLSNKKE